MTIPAIFERNWKKFSYNFQARLSISIVAISSPLHGASLQSSLCPQSHSPPPLPKRKETPHQGMLVANTELPEITLWIFPLQVPGLTFCSTVFVAIWTFEETLFIVNVQHLCVVLGYMDHFCPLTPIHQFSVDCLCGKHSFIYLCYGMVRSQSRWRLEAICRRP